MAVRSTQGQNRAVRRTQAGSWVSPSYMPDFTMYTGSNPPYLVPNGSNKLIGFMFDVPKVGNNLFRNVKPFCFVLNIVYT